MSAPASPTKATAPSAAWLRTLHQWHWISSAFALVGMMLFAITGITLNHASQIESKPVITAQKAQLPPELLAHLQALVVEGEPPSANTQLPLTVSDWLQRTWGTSVAERAVEWSADEAYIAMPRPGGDAWLRIDIATGEAEHEVTDRGWISWLNDLHKGRHTGVLWSWFIDAFAVICLIFSATGLLILKYHSAKRPGTWPLVGLGLVLPALIAILFIH